MQYLALRTVKFEFTIGLTWITTLDFRSFTNYFFKQAQLDLYAFHQIWVYCFHQVMMELLLLTIFSLLEKDSFQCNYLHICWRSKMTNRYFSEESWDIRDFKITWLQNMFLTNQSKLNNLLKVTWSRNNLS